MEGFKSRELRTLDSAFGLRSCAADILTECDRERWLVCSWEPSKGRRGRELEGVQSSSSGRRVVMKLQAAVSHSALPF